jgi:Asp-tRNA(Asn)/Glu-tRNA(Gln) amidotransferase A subunit family amidase
MTEPFWLTATEVLRRIASGKLDARAYRESCLERIAAREPVVRAFTQFDPDLVRRRARHAPLGALHGLPMAVKDVLDTADQPAEYGSPIWAGHRPFADAASVAWARAAGAVVMGKTVTTEFATRKPGPTANPAGLSHTPGGSSSGSAAAVADCMVPFAFGTQTAGSIIRPAAFCGVVGYKPSFGTIPLLGMKVMAQSLDTIGTMARSVADCALLAGAAGGVDLGDPDQKPGRAPRIGLCRSASWKHAAPETQALFDRIAAPLARAGANIVDCELPAAFDVLETAQPLVMNGESARSMGWELTTARAGLSEGLLERLQWGLAQGAAALAEAQGAFRRLQDAFPAAMGECDILLTPSAPGEAPAGLDWTGDPAFNYIWTALHVPCVTVPAGQGPTGMPLGMQIVGRRGDDRATLAWAQWVAAAIG